MPAPHLENPSNVTVGIVTVSDSAARGQREDVSGQTIRQMVEKAGFQVVEYTIIPDQQNLIAATLEDFADERNLDLILTTGGTGLGPRDVTPQATLQVIDYQVPGLVEIVRVEGFKKAPTAILSRAVAGVRGHTLIINLPGSPRAVQEALGLILGVIPHAVALLRGELTEHQIGPSQGG